MKNVFLIYLSIFFLSFNCLAQPYAGTIFVDPDIIIASDSSTFESVSYTGQGIRTVFDRRVNDWTTINAFLFTVIWNDGLTSEAVVNPEFGDSNTAEVEAEKYGWFIGQLPTCLREDVDEIWIHKGVELFGGGNNSILIHTGQSSIYQNDGILEETLVHEASHTSLDALHANSSGWLAAQGLDGQFVSDYAEEFPLREDIAESFLLWIAVRFRSDRISQQDFDLITQTIPNRLNYFDTITCNMFPIVEQVVSSVNENQMANTEIPIYPNPVKDILYFKNKHLKEFEVNLYDARGVLLRKYRNNNQQIDVSNFPGGLYLIMIRSEEILFTRKFLKE